MTGENIFCNELAQQTFHVYCVISVHMYYISVALTRNVHSYQTNTCTYMNVFILQNLFNSCIY